MVNKFFYNLNTNPSNGGIDAQPAQNDQPSQTTSLENSSDPALNHGQIKQANQPEPKKQLAMAILLQEEYGFFGVERLNKCDNTPIVKGVNIKDTVKEALSLVVVLIDRKEPALVLMEKMFANDSQWRKKTLRLGYLILNEYTTRGDETAIFMLSRVCAILKKDEWTLFDGVKVRKFKLNKNYHDLLANGDRDNFIKKLLIQYPGIAQKINELFIIETPQNLQQSQAPSETDTEDATLKSDEALQIRVAREKKRAMFFSETAQTTSLENSSDPALNHEQIEQANATNLTECQPNLAGVRTSSDRVASGYPDGLRHRNIPPSKIERTEHQAEVKCNKTVTATREKRKMI